MKMHVRKGRICDTPLQLEDSHFAFTATQFFNRLEILIVVERNGK